MTPSQNKKIVEKINTFSITITRSDFEKLRDLIEEFENVDSVECIQEDDGVRFKIYIEDFEVTFKRNSHE